MSNDRWQANLFTIAMTLASRGLMARDFLLGVARKMPKHPAREAFSFASGERRLAAVMVEGPPDVPVVLICHGIGERVENWSAVQTYLRERGVGSIVFNYSGYGDSTGRICAEHCDEDLASAYEELRRRVGAHTPVCVLGFSLGSGIAGSGAAALKPPVAGVFLCEAFSSFREAALRAGWPKLLAGMVPDIWNTVEAVREIRLPVCVVHSDGDRLFPVTMATRIAEACGERGELIVVRGLAHNEPYLRPDDVYWGQIVERVLATDQMRSSSAR